VAPGNADLIRSVYNIDWIDVTQRERGFSAAAEVIVPETKARVSPEVADRTLLGLGDFAVFIQGLEQDFSEFRYDADEFAEPVRDVVVVTGHIRVRGRMSRMPLTAPFGHVWRLRDGRAMSIEAHLDPEEALSAAARA
jgi:hypothetical protein